ncbi:MAG: hypothetical protein Q9207_005945 [Kuettlingeria erythrocarpa]
MAFFDERVPNLFSWCQKSKVLQQNRQLDKENSGSVDYLGYVEPLLAGKYAAVDYG